MPQQAAVLEEISIVTGSCGLDDLCGLQDLIHKKLTGVKRVVILLESINDKFYEVTRATARYHEYFKDRGTALFPTSVSSVAIAMYSIAGTHRSEILSAEDARSWELEMEQLIVGVQ